MSVRGLTVSQAREQIERAYLQGAEPILKPGSNRILVSLMRKRTVRVTVIRQDRGAASDFRGRSGATRRSDQSSTGNIVNLPAGENDVLNALIRTGGMPGINEKSEIRIQRGQRATSVPAYIDVSYGNSEFPRTGTDASFSTHQSYRPSYPQGRSIPTRPQHGQPVDRRQSELRNGDVVYVDSRQSEVYFTGGLLNGGQHLLPRDHDLDVLEAVATVGRITTTRANPAQPTELLVLRRVADNGQNDKRQISMRVDMNRALSDPNQRILVAPGDTLLLRYKATERALNFGNAVFNTYGIGRLGR